MTTQDSAVDPTPRSGTPSAFFVPDGDAFVPAPIARGPWGQTISGNYVGGLLGYVLERDAGDPEFQPARLTVDLFRPAESEAHRLIETAVKEAELDYAMHDSQTGGLPSIVVAVPAERRFVTNTVFTVSVHGVRIEGFICRNPEENHQGVYRYLLRRNRKLYGLAYTLDNLGDIYLVGRMALESVTAEELDRIFGQVVDAVDRDFNALLELGFRSSIQKEWKWRVSRGESLKNLQAFQHLVDDDPD